MTVRGRALHRVVHGGCRFPSCRTRLLHHGASSVSRVARRLGLRTHAMLSPSSVAVRQSDRLPQQLFPVTRARCRALRLPRADLPDDERRVLCPTATPPSTSS